MVGLALLIDRNRRALVALAAAALPGLAWAALGHTVNEAATPVNYFARLATIREYWWNPHLYLDPWWARSIVFTVYDALGLFGVAACIWTIVSARKRSFELALMLLPAAMTILVFNYHSASHRYYTLIWLPFVLVAGVELALDRLRRLDGVLLISAVVALAIAGLAERDAGAVERYIARQPEAAVPFFHPWSTATFPRRDDALSRAALTNLKAEGVTFVGYLGNQWLPLLDLHLRGWAVDAPSPDPRENQRRSRVPVSVVRAEERFRLSADWFRDRLARGMDALLIERGGPFDNPEVLGWARTAGLQPAGVQPPGHMLLRPARR
jgi:hypothetical protein